MTIQFPMYFRVLVVKPLGDVCDVPNTHFLIQPSKLGCIHVQLITHSITNMDLSESVLIRIRASPTTMENAPM
ncbi:hypothetical protein Hanom_Chr04g00314101 [Helianthus anomalus]